MSLFLGPNPRTGRAPGICPLWSDGAAAGHLAAVKCCSWKGLLKRARRDPWRRGLLAHEQAWSRGLDHRWCLGWVGWHCAQTCASDGDCGHFTGHEGIASLICVVVSKYVLNIWKYNSSQFTHWVQFLMYHTWFLGGQSLAGCNAVSPPGDTTKSFSAINGRNSRPQPRANIQPAAYRLRPGTTQGDAHQRHKSKLFFVVPFCVFWYFSCCVLVFSLSLAFLETHFHITSSTSFSLCHLLLM